MEKYVFLFFSSAQAEKTSAKMKSMKEEMDRLRALADDRERLSMTAQSMEDRLKERETQASSNRNRVVVVVVIVIVFPSLAAVFIFFCFVYYLLVLMTKKKNAIQARPLL